LKGKGGRVADEEGKPGALACWRYQICNLTLRRGGLQTGGTVCEKIVKYREGKGCDLKTDGAGKEESQIIHYKRVL